ncbi:MAG TPA: prepilin-type N-terminal cleavage/methylation domain-containing protein [Myxococcales bacterium]|nr:prepilin-type N-terminal cleavage/methylation domain-containing protein [Myxococcales bacterium]
MNKFLGKSKKGFTLIELMIVVAIIGILAAIAIPNFVRFQLKAKTSEGKVNLAAIRTAEEAYFSEFGSYVAAAASPGTNGSTAKVSFVDSGTVAAGNFDTIGWAPEGQVFFNYEVVVNGAAYVASAGADIDGNGTDQSWGYVQAGTATTPPVVVGTLGLVKCSVATSLSNQVIACDPTYGQSEF